MTSFVVGRVLTTTTGDFGIDIEAGLDLFIIGLGLNNVIVKKWRAMRFVLRIKIHSYVQWSLSSFDFYS